MSTLVRLDEARRALAEARSLDEVKEIRDKALAVREYARAAKLGLEMQQDAAAVKLRAERRAGEMLREMDGLGSHGGNRKSSTSPGLETLGISRNQSSQWQKVASFDDERFEQLLAEQREADREVTTAYMLRAWRRERKKQADDGDYPTLRFLDFNEVLARGEKFGTVYADPPWQYGNQGTRGATGDHYAGMTVDEIAAMPVIEAVADRAHLHLWTTNAFLFDAKRVMEAWGFEYKSCFVWVKPQMGMGNYWRVSHEYLLLGVRGGERFAVRDEMSWREWPRAQHSAKPGGMYAVIERTSPGPYLEMFARNQRRGWVSWGNELDQSDLFFSQEAAS